MNLSTGSFFQVIFIRKQIFLSMSSIMMILSSQHETIFLPNQHDFYQLQPVGVQLHPSTPNFSPFICINE
jgi:hypothetical protein